MNKGAIGAAMINSAAVGVCSMAVLASAGAGHPLIAFLNALLVAFNAWLAYMNYHRGIGE